MQGQPLVGRHAEMTIARAALDRVLAGRGALLVVSGEAGIGKTAFADAFAAEAERAGSRTVWGRCWEAGGAPAYWPWTQVFRALKKEDPFASTSDAGGGEARDARFRVFDRAAEQLRVCALTSPVIVLLDDLHAADVPSLLFLQLVARSLRAGARLGVLATYRETEARIAGEVATILAKIAREGESIAPARLTLDEVATWIRSEQPGATDATVARVHQASEGNPLFVRELLRVRTSIDATNLPDGLLAILDEHIARVKPETRALLAIASAIGREWSEADLARLAGLRADDLAQRLADARTSGLITTIGPGSHAFTHILVRDRLYADFTPSRRAEVHVAVGECLVARGDIEAAAHHVLAAGVKQAATVALDAARRALSRFAFEDASQFASRALEIAERPSEVACELEMVLAESLIRIGDSVRGKEVALRAAAMAAALDAPRLLAQAALVYGAQTLPGMVDPLMVDVLRRGLDALGEDGCDDVLRARVMARLAAALVPASDPDGAREILRLVGDAIAMARRLGDADTMLFVLRFAGAGAGYVVSSEERFAYARETHALAKELDRPVIILERGAV